MVNEEILQQLVKDVAEIKVKVDHLYQGKADLKMENAKRIDDHEKRLRWLEKYAFYLIGAFGLTTIIISVIK